MNDAARLVLDRAIGEWSRGDFYEAHETLEDFAEHLEEDDADHERALALVHVAACFHKLINDVGRSAVPSKMEQALEVLRRAPSTWQELDLGALTAALEVLLPQIRRGSVPRADELPPLRR